MVNDGADGSVVMVSQNWVTRSIPLAAPVYRVAMGLAVLAALREFFQQITNGSSFVLYWVLNRQFLSNGRWK
jgi:hypothetical protein